MYLPEILGHTRLVVAERKVSADLQAMERAAAAHVPRGFARVSLRATAAKWAGGDCGVEEGFAVEGVDSRGVRCGGVGAADGGWRRGRAFGADG